MRAEDSKFTLTRRKALSLLASAGIGTAVFQRALVAKAADGPVTREMIAEAEWVAGITLSEAQRETAVNVLKWAREKAERVRAIEIENSQLPGLNFTPLASPAAQPDPRGYAATKPPEPGDVSISKPDSDEDLVLADADDDAAPNFAGAGKI